MPASRRWLKFKLNQAATYLDLFNIFIVVNLSLHASPGFHFVQLKLILFIYVRIGILHFFITWVGTIQVGALFQLRQNCCIAAILNALVMAGALGMLNKVHLYHGQIMAAVYWLFYVVIMEPQAHIAQFIPHKCIQCNVLRVAIHLLDQ